MKPPLIRLGDIEYSNCFPVHARLIEEGPPRGVSLVRGTPAQLNEALAHGRIDVAPCSSIEYARHAGRYVLLPDLAIASDGEVGSILLESRVPVAELMDRTVAVPTASATSVVLLRALVEEREGVRPAYRWFDQGRTDPFGDREVAAALWIGDVALRRAPPAGHRLLDLGRAWTEWTGLPFVYALWQARRAPALVPGLERLHRALLASRAWFKREVSTLADRYARHYGIAADRLLHYWTALRYDMDERLEQGLLRFFEHAVRLGEAESVPSLEWLAQRTPTQRDPGRAG